MMTVVFGGCLGKEINLLAPSITCLCSGFFLALATSPPVPLAPSCCLHWLVDRQYASETEGICHFSTLSLQEHPSTSQHSSLIFSSVARGCLTLTSIKSCFPYKFFPYRWPLSASCIWARRLTRLKPEIGNPFLCSCAWYVSRLSWSGERGREGQREIPL